MISFIAAVIALILGFLLYGKIVEKNFAPDDRETPAVAMQDGVDYVPMPTWKVFLIQLLNIAGTGPIFGALSGALFGPVVYLWIVFGCIFAGAVHDYGIGMISMRNRGCSVSEIVGDHLGGGMRQVMRVFSVILLIMCGVVFTKGPADLLAILTNNAPGPSFWFWIVLLYYFIATFVPIDKVIGKFYPVFGVLLIVMALGVSGSMLFSGSYEMPELWDHFANEHPEGIGVWPFMFITVACGAISGFHATQSPMMARCCKNEFVGRKVFYGAMIAEGIIALVWAAAGVSCYESGQALLEAGAGCSAVVYTVCRSTMGKIGSVIALLGVIACPISSGDTAYRSARLTLADWFRSDQASFKNRLIITVPLLVTGFLISRIDYTVVWRYFSWSNQTLAMIGLWACSVYLARSGKKWIITAVPAVFMSAVTVSYFFMADECLGMLWKSLSIDSKIYTPAAAGLGAAAAMAFLLLFIRKKGSQQTDRL
ncbi:MAG: carbon starvation CstA family protein [Clostridia bacterium]|nr:carbon starvation CstA family protein [Clostridia bacterium]